MLQATPEQSYPNSPKYIPGDPAQLQEEELVKDPVHHQLQADVCHCVRGEGKQGSWGCFLYLCDLLGSFLHHEPGGRVVRGGVHPARVHGGHGTLAGLCFLPPPSTLSSTQLSITTSGGLLQVDKPNQYLGPLSNIALPYYIPCEFCKCFSTL